MPDREMIRQTLVELLEKETGNKPESVDDPVNLREQLGLDSLDLVGVVMQVENRFRIRLTHQELEKVACVGDLLNLLEAKISESGEAAAGESAAA
jgi:acyl carrier protein